MMTEQDVQTLLEGGITAARVGDIEMARQYLEDVLALDENNEEAWLWLASISEELTEKQAHFQRVLSINPQNEQAKAGLEWVRKKLGEASQAVSVGRATQPEVMYCAYHPQRETLLRCSKCGNPICVDCGIRTPVGVRCRECAQLRRLPIYEVSVGQYLLAFVVASGASTLAGFFIGFLGSLWLTLFLAPAVGGLIAEVMDRVTGHKRGLGLQIVAGVSIVLGAFLGLLLLPPVLPNMILYAVLAIVAAAARLR